MKNMCTSKTNLYCIIGDPIKHCQSPLIHNLAFNYLGIDSVFLAFSCNSETIPNVFDAIRTLDIKGGAITMPVKEMAMSFVDSIENDAKLIGSINVFKNDNGHIRGYNTDGLGVVRFLQSKNISYKNAVIVGAGGAGKSIAVQLALHGAQKIVICDKDNATATSLAANINDNVTTCSAIASSASEPNLISLLNDANIMINATPLGMHPLEDFSVLNSFVGVPKNVVFMDCCYSPTQTKLMRLAEQNGFIAYNGHGMLLYQGAEAFKIWTSQTYPLDFILSQNFFEYI